MENTEASVWNASAEVFQASSTFICAKPGWCFKLGTYGLGYYFENPVEELRNELEDYHQAITLESSAQLAMLRLACRGRFDIVSKFLAKAPHLWRSTFEDGTTLVHLAAIHGAVDFLKLALSDSGLDVNIGGERGRTPLMLAAGFGRISAMRLLISSDADPRRQDAAGATAIMIAGQNNQHTSMLLLLALSSDEKKSALADVDIKGRSVVHWTAAAGDLEGLRFLRGFCADLNQVDTSQNTALHLAVAAENSRNFKEILRLLTKHGVDLNQENRDGQTCLDIAKGSDKPNILAALERARSQSTKEQMKKIKPLDLEAGVHERVDNTFQKTFELYYAMALWISCVSFTVFEYMMDIRQVALQSWWLYWVDAIFELGLVTTVLLFIYVARLDPGSVPSNQPDPDSFLRALREGQDIPASRICMSSWVLKDLRTKYCKESGACIQEFDHWCDFIAGAIGKNNHRPFIVLLMLEPAVQCWYLLLCAMTVLYTQGLPVSVWETPMWAVQSAWQYPLMVIAVMVHYSALFFVLYNCAFQIQLIANNTTVNECANWERYTHFWIDPQIPHSGFKCPFCKGDPFSNMVDFWWHRQRAEVGPHCNAEVRDLVAVLRGYGAK